MSAAHINAHWFMRNLVTQHTAHWLAHSPQPNGFYRNGFDRRWQPNEQQVGTLVSQGRLMYVFACGHKVTGEAAYLKAVQSGADFMLRHFLDEQFGGWYWMLAPDGTVLDTDKHAYGMAFAMWGMAHAYAVTGDDRYRQAAEATWDTIEQKLRDPLGGITLTTRRDFSGGKPENNQNHMMHLYESLMATYEITGQQKFFQAAAGIAKFLFGRLYRECPNGDGYLAEDGDQQWQAKPTSQGGRINLGHQLEWAYLLGRGVDAGLPESYLALGHKLVDFGLRAGWMGQGIYTWGDEQARPKIEPLGWWQQNECLRALMHYAAARGRDDLWPYYQKCLDFIRQKFDDAEYGGCYESVMPEPPHVPQRDNKGHVYKAGYHVAAMHMEALRLTGLVAAFGRPKAR